MDKNPTRHFFRIIVLGAMLLLTPACGASASEHSLPPMEQSAAVDVSMGGTNRDAAASSPVEQKLIKTARLSIQIRKERDIPEAVARGAKIAEGLDGYVTSQSERAITFKVPNGRLDEALAAAAELGKVKDRDVSANDVTRQYVDLASRIGNLRTLRTRLQELVTQGQNVKEILEVEKELSRVTTELEALEAQMRLLENQTTYATVTLRFHEKVTPGPVGWVFYGLYHGVKWMFVWD